LPVPSGLRAPDDDTLHARVRNRSLLLDSVKSEKDDRKTHEPKLARRVVSRKSKRKARGGSVVVPEAEWKYDIYEPLAELWRSYADKVITGVDAVSAGDRVLRMDLHGAVVEVVRARDPGLVGLRGILIIETANTVLVVTKKNRVLTVPKNAAIIRVDFGEKSFEIALPMLPYRASERSARKVKKKHLALF
jgi:ribonuclease P protein subunit POP4